MKKMKTCSKCKRELDPGQFVKSPRYSDGLYPSCKECRRAVQSKWLEGDPLCRHCRKVPHPLTHQWCYDCQRKLDKRNLGPPKWRRDSKNKRCSFCKVNPRLPYHNYCESCQRTAQNKWMRSQGGSWAYSLKKGRHLQVVARAYVNHQVQT